MAWGVTVSANTCNTPAYVCKVSSRTLGSEARSGEVLGWWERSGPRVLTLSQPPLWQHNVSSSCACKAAVVAVAHKQWVGPEPASSTAVVLWRRQRQSPHIPPTPLPTPPHDPYCDPTPCGPFL